MAYKAHFDQEDRNEYGKQKTKLKLSEKAEWYVNRLDDFHIYEYEIIPGYIVYTYGWFDDESDAMTEEELNSELEYLAEEMEEELANEMNA